LLVDEVLAVGDAAFQKKCLGKMGDVAKKGRTILFVSHNMAAIQNLCHKACLLQRGELVAIGQVTDIITTYLQSAESIEDNTLEQRTDRQGNSKLRFISFKADNFICGSPTQFSIAYKGTIPLRNVHISTSVSNIFGEPVAYLSNDLTQDLFSEVTAEGEFVCRFEKMPLLPGTYTLNFYCTVNGIIADWITNAATVQVIEGDFYGTGKLPSQSYKVAISHEWKAINDKS